MKNLLAVLIICMGNLFLFAQTEIEILVFPTDTIKPFDLTSNPVNFPLAQTTPISDLNGDGPDDLVFYYRFAADERTLDPTDHINKNLL